MHDIRFHRHAVEMTAPDGCNVIAVCGKGGVGKTAFSAMLVHELSRMPQAGNVLAVDADPALGLVMALGLRDVPTIGEVRERVVGAATLGDAEQERLIAENLDMLVFDSVVEQRDYSVLAMGRTDTLGCYCSVNDILRDALRMLLDKFDTIVIDGEAGLEQLNRQVASHVSRLLLLSDGSARSMNTVELLRDIAVREHMAQPENVQLVFSRSTLASDELAALAENAGIPVLGCVPFDEAVVRADAGNISLSSLGNESPAAHEVAHIAAHVVGAAHHHE